MEGLLVGLRLWHQRAIRSLAGRGQSVSHLYTSLVRYDLAWWCNPFRLGSYFIGAPKVAASLAMSANLSSLHLIGCTQGYAILRGADADPIMYALMFGLVAGMMVYISLVELLPTALR